MASLDVTTNHTAHVTIESDTKFDAVIMLGIGYYPSVFPDKMDPDDEESAGGKKEVKLDVGEQTVDILVGLNNYEKWHDPGWEADLVQVLYIEDADTGDVIMEDTGVDDLITLVYP